LHERRWKQEGQPGVLSYESAPRFHRMAAQSLLKSGMLRMYGMRLNGSIIGVIYGFAAHGTVYCYLQGFDPEFVRLSAGAQTLGHLIDVSVRSGEVAIDLLRGEEPYKYGWGAQDEQTYRLGLWVRSASPNIEQRQPSAVA
jgi:CelD/BcsL family acetyltransferase involved in cellulose biosynthesis